MAIVAQDLAAGQYAGGYAASAPHWPACMKAGANSDTDELTYVCNWINVQTSGLVHCVLANGDDVTLYFDPGHYHIRLRKIFSGASTTAGGVQALL
jgi:hypothetical protein